jgi:hypothetical protein
MAILTDCCANVPLHVRSQGYYITHRGTETEVSMKRLVSALAAAALVATPIAASAQSHGGHFGGGGSRSSFGGGGFHSSFGGGGFRGGGFRGGFGPFFGGFGLGLGFASPWYYGWGPYWDDYYGPWGYGPGYYGYGGDYGPPPPPAPGATPPPQACGSWNWRADQQRYVWIAAPCAAQPAPPAQ